MGKQLYRYNPSTCQFEPHKLTRNQVAKRVLIYLILGLAIAVPASNWYIQRFASLEEQKLILENKTLLARWEKLNDQIDKATTGLDSLVTKDDYYYRTLLDLAPLTNSVREAGVGGSERLAEDKQSYQLVRFSYERMEKLKNQLEVARQSYDLLNQEADKKLTMWASRPAIQPIHKKQLRTLHLTFGLRMHPIFHTMMDHKGLDFTAAYGTPVYATANGRVSMAYFSDSYGNVVFIDHGFSYETRYAHLQKFIVKAGNFVKRGDIIGYVGSTGISAAPHLHYEVFFKGEPINPIHFFQRDLSPKEYQKIIQPASASANEPTR